MTIHPDADPDTESHTRSILRCDLSPHDISLLPTPNPIKPKGKFHTNFNVIGHRTCSIVFEIYGTQRALKKGKDQQGLWTDAALTSLACRSEFEINHLLRSRFPNSIVPQVPQVHGWIRVDEMDEWWIKNKAQFPNGDDEVGYLFFL